jgi:hypothetical protein
MPPVLQPGVIGWAGPVSIVRVGLVALWNRTIGVQPHLQPYAFQHHLPGMIQGLLLPWFALRLQLLPLRLCRPPGSMEDDYTPAPPPKKVSPGFVSRLATLAMLVVLS